MERIAGWSATHRKTAVISWLLLVAAVFAGGRMIPSTNVPSYDAGQSGQAEQTLNRLNVTSPPAREDRGDQEQPADHRGLAVCPAPPGDAFHGRALGPEGRFCGFWPY